jgi:hypothetical protein
MDNALFNRWLEHLDREGYLDAELILRELFVHLDSEGRPCSCSCHPSLGSLRLHDPAACPCIETAEQRAARTRELLAAWDAKRATWEASAQGRAEATRQSKERADLEAWVAADPGVEIAEWGGAFPEQWWGKVDGHSFFFREKRGHWRIELDLRPTGCFYKSVVTSHDPDVPADFSRTEQVEIEEGNVIAEGWETDLGVTPLHHGRFIVNTIRTHLRSEGCPHPGARKYCPECGQSMA